ncbi:MAG: TraB/GumN family protein [Alphaproteobacteria bacterium]|nr:TraB/GumN family protein [Alphaproteobacteria bacterium]
MFHPLATFHKFHSIRTGWALGTIALLHIIFALTFLIVLVLASTRAEAAQDACRGDNLLEKLAVDSPAELEQLRQAANNIPNGESLLWRIEGEGLTPSWLYGTMHVTDPRVLEMSDAARAGFGAAQTVVLESAELGDLGKAQAALMTNPELTMLTDGSTLQSLLEGDDLRRVEAALDERNVPMVLVSRMKPWMVFSIIAAPSCELERRGKGVPFLDKKLADDAIAGGKTLKGLETLAEQMSILTNLPIDLQVRLLAETAALGDTLDDMMATMTDLYLAGQINMIMPLIEFGARESGGDHGAYAQFERDMVETRNRNMAERLQPMLQDGNAFVAVGALHLPGEDGLVQLLRERGYRVTPAS